MASDDERHNNEYDGGEDDDAMEVDEDTPAPDRPADCWAITKESLSTAQQQDLSMVMNLLKIKHHHAHTLLINHRWKMDCLHDLFDRKGQVSMLREAGVALQENHNCRASPSRMVNCMVRLNGCVCPSPQYPALKVERSHAAASIGAIVVSSSEADSTFECLNVLKSLSPKNDLKFLKEFKVLYILICVDKEFMPLADKIIEVTTRRRVVWALSNKKTATLKIKDLYKLKGFLGWSWKDILKKLLKIKTEVKFILYVKQKGQLVEAIKALHLDHIYLLGDTECETVEANPPLGWEVLKVGNLVH